MITSRDWVVDASVVLKWYLTKEELADKASLFLNALYMREVRLTAPRIMAYEVVNGLLRASRTGRISRQDVSFAYSSLLQLEIEQELGDRVLAGAGIELAQKFSTNFYDTLYLALADLQGSTCITADRKFFNRVRNRVGNLVWLGDVA